MKFIYINIILFTLSLASPYLQDGLYPKCSYVEVTADGWKVHKNHEGRILSMLSPELHNLKTGKYSFDKFGNLVDFNDCFSNDMVSKMIDNKANENSAEADIELSFDFSQFKFEPSLSVHGGATFPNGDNLPYETGYNYGISINPNLPGFLSKISFSFSGLNLPNKNSDLSSLTSNGFFVNYSINKEKFYLLGGIGMLNQEGTLNNGSDANGSDMAIKGEFGFNVNKKISLFTQGYLTTTFLEAEQSGTFYSLGLKYNF